MPKHVLQQLVNTLEKRQNIFRQSAENISHW